MPFATAQRASQYVRLAYDAIRLRHSEEASVRASVRRHLVHRLGRLHGLPQKVGQLLSLAGEQSSDLQTTFRPLQEAVEPLPVETITKLLERAWGQPIERHLDELEPAAAAASLGQVHRGRLKDGRVVAIKVQYPGIRQAVDDDLRMLGWVSWSTDRLRPTSSGFRLADYREEIQRTLNTELNYLAEADAQATCHEIARPEARIVIPQVLPELCRTTVLVSEWIASRPWYGETFIPDTPARRELAEQLPNFFFRSLFRYGKLHADWHPGNIRLIDSGDNLKLGLLDFGCIYEPTPQDQRSLARLIDCGLQGTDPWHLFVELGFDADKLEPIRHRLGALLNVLVEPFASGPPLEFCQWSLGERLQTILGDDRWNFRLAGPPRHLLLMRAWSGLKRYQSYLGERTSWRTPYFRHAADWHLRELNSQPANRVVARPLAATSSKPQSDHLRVRVQDAGQTKVQLTFPIRQLHRLEELLEEDLLQRIAERGLDLQQLASQAARQSYAPQTLFELVEQQKCIRVWID